MYESILREVCGSDLRYRVLRTLYEEPGRELHLSGVAAAAGAESGNVHRMLKKLVAAQLCEQIPGSPYPRYRANPGSPLYSELHKLFSRGREILSAVENVAKTLDGTIAIYGSVARGEDRANSDIDVLVIGPGSSIMAQAAFKPVSRKYDRKVNATSITADGIISQLDAGSGFWRDVLTGPLIMLKGEIPDAITRRLSGSREQGVSKKSRRSPGHS